MGGCPSREKRSDKHPQIPGCHFQKSTRSDIAVSFPCNHDFDQQWKARLKDHEEQYTKIWNLQSLCHLFRTMRCWVKWSNAVVKTQNLRRLKYLNQIKKTQMFFRAWTARYSCLNRIDQKFRVRKFLAHQKMKSLKDYFLGWDQKWKILIRLLLNKTSELLARRFRKRSLTQLYNEWHILYLELIRYHMRSSERLVNADNRSSFQNLKSNFTAWRLLTMNTLAAKFNNRLRVRRSFFCWVMKFKSLYGHPLEFSQSRMTESYFRSWQKRHHDSNQKIEKRLDQFIFGNRIKNLKLHFLRFVSAFRHRKGLDSNGLEYYKAHLLNITFRYWSMVSCNSSAHSQSLPDQQNGEATG